MLRVFNVAYSLKIKDKNILFEEKCEKKLQNNSQGNVINKLRINYYCKQHEAARNIGFR